MDNTRDQTVKRDGDKLRMELIPPETYEALGRVLTFGARKYSPESWKEVERPRYVGALLRHLTAYLKDPHSVDEESGLPHVEHLLCNAAFLQYFEQHPQTALGMKWDEGAIVVPVEI